MKKIAKIFSVALSLLVMPFTLFAQQPGQIKLTDYNFHNLATIEERVFLLHSIQESEIYSYRLSNEEGKIDIFVSEEYTCEDSNANADFDFFLENLYNDWVAYSNMDKMERGSLFVDWRYQLTDDVFLAINEDFFHQLRNRDNSTCDGADPFCTDNGLYQFPAGVNAGNLGSSTPPYYCSGFVRPNGAGSSNCLYTTPNPAFYYMQIDQPGNLNIYMYSTPSHDIDFDCWGPFSDITTACSNWLVAIWLTAVIVPQPQKTATSTMPKRGNTISCSSPTTRMQLVTSLSQILAQEPPTAAFCLLWSTTTVHIASEKPSS